MITAWTEPGFATIAQIIEKQTGLTWSAPRVDSAESGMRRAMQRARVDSVPEYARLIRQDDVARDELIAELTIGETYFFRDPAQFSLIRERIVPELRASAAERQLRVWSAGCASGEEPHSLAIVLLEQGLGERAAVLGTDIARHRLAAARKGEYSQWSLRGVPPSVVARYFTKDGRRYRLDPRICRLAEFRYLNLAEDRYPSLASGVWAMDLVLCRNVLIYFDRATVARVARRLIDSLADDGWLLLGATDPPIAEFTDCEVHVTDAGVAYRRAGRKGGRAGGLPAGPAHRAGPPGELTGEEPPLPPADADVSGTRPATWPAAPPGEPPPSEPAPDAASSATRAGAAAHGPSPGRASPGGAAAMPAAAAAAGDDAASGYRVRPPAARSPLDLARAAYAAHDYEVAAAHAREVAAGAGTAEPWTIHVRALANLGRLAEASRACLAALDEHPSSAELQYLHAVLLAQAERTREAAAAARHALYLDRRLIVGHIAHADATGRLGDETAARRSLRNAERLLAALPAEANVPASDGERAGRLLQLVRTRLRLMEAA